MVHNQSEAAGEQDFGLADMFPLACRDGLEAAISACGRVVAGEDESPAAIPSARALIGWVQRALADEEDWSRPVETSRDMSRILRLVRRPLWEWSRSSMPRACVESLMMRHELARVQRLAVEALFVIHGGHWREAKRIQVEVSGGRPLAVCAGVPVSWPLVDGKVEKYVWYGFSSGCGAIFEDASSARAKPFAIYCPDDRNRRRQPEREARDTIKRRHRRTVR